MKCIRCGAEVPDGAKFCGECGFQFSQSGQTGTLNQGGYNQTGNLNQGMYNQTGNLNQGAYQQTGNLNQGVYQSNNSNQNGYWQNGQYVKGTPTGQGVNGGKSKNGGCLKVVLICVAAFIGLSILVAACSLLGGDSSDKSSTPTQEKTTEVTASSETTSSDTTSSDTTSSDVTSESTEENKEINEADAGLNEKYSYISECENIKYEDLARKPDDYTGKKVMFWGTVSQVLQEGNSYQYQIYSALGENSDGFVFYELPEGKGRILENDKVAVFATYEGLMTYETTRGDERTVPKYNAMLIENVNDIIEITSEFEGLLGDYSSEDGGQLKVYTDSTDIYIDIIEDNKTVISTIVMGVHKDSGYIFCSNIDLEMDTVISVDKENKKIYVVAGLDEGKSKAFKLTKEQENSSKDNKNNEEDKTEAESERNDIVDKGVKILNTAVADALDDGDIVYMTAVDNAKANGGTWVIDFSMDVFVDEYRDAFMDQLVGKIGDSDRISLDMALKETQIKINIKEDGSFTVTTKDFSSGTESSNNSEYYFADSDSRYLTEDDLVGLSKDDLAYARNEIYARHGYIFKEERFSWYFNTRTWYVPKYTGEEFDDSVFNEFERKNIEFIKSHE